MCVYMYVIFLYSEQSHVENVYIYISIYICMYVCKYIVVVLCFL